MAAKMVSLRLDEELLAWATTYAESRGVSRTALLEEGLRSFKEDCEQGVPEIRAIARRQTSVRNQVLEALQGVGDCPERPGELGHIWKSPRVDPFRSCSHCGKHGREPALGTDPSARGKDEGGGYFAEATAERTELFNQVRPPASSHGKVK